MSTVQLKLHNQEIHTKLFKYEFFKGKIGHIWCKSHRKSGKFYHSSQGADKKKTPGVNIYQKCLKFKNVPICSEGGGQHFSKMSEIQKCPNLVRGGGGGSTFFKNVPNQKMSQRSEGGGESTLIGTLSQIFSIFYFDGSPYQADHLRIKAC